MGRRFSGRTARAASATLALAGVIAIFVNQLTPEANALAIAEVPTGVEAALRDHHGTTIRGARQADVEKAGGVIDGSTAIQKARGRFAIGSDSPAAAYLAFFTNWNHGLVDENGTVTPTYRDRLAWLIVIPNFLHTSHGPIGSNPRSTTATLVVFVDATSGGFLFASGSGR